MAVDSVTFTGTPAPADAPAPEAKPEGGELLAGKYKTTEDLVKGYQELQAEYSRVKGATPSPEAKPSGTAAPEAPQPETKPEAKPEALPDEFVEAAGGAATLTQMVAWGVNGLSAADKALINAGMAAGGEAAKAAAESFKSKYEAALGKDPQLIPGSSAPNVSSGYESVPQMLEAMRDPRYQKDPAYRKSVEAKIAAMKSEVY